MVNLKNKSDLRIFEHVHMEGHPSVFLVVRRPIKILNIAGFGDGKPNLIERPR